MQIDCRSLPVFRLLSFFSWLVLCLVLFHPITVVAQTVVECPAIQLELEKVDFNKGECKKSLLQEYQISEHSVWLLISDPFINRIPNQTLPTGLFVSGPISAKIYVNGFKIGEKGKSALSYDSEIPGKFDWVGYVPATALKESSNQIAMHISNFNGRPSDFHAFNSLHFGLYQPHTQTHLVHYSPTLIPLGALLLSVIYLLRRLSLAPKKTGLLYLLIMTLAATFQLLTEVFRGVYAYAYPSHDIRLNMILLFAFIFGQALLIQALIQFTQLKQKYPVVLGLSLIVIFQILIDDRDLRAASVIQIPAVIAACCIVYERYRCKIHQYTPSIILLAFSVLIYATPYNFLDIYLYYCMAALLAYLFSSEALNTANQQKSLVLEKQRAEKLQLILELKEQEDANHSIAIKEAGKMTMLKIHNILFCKGAGDYVEVYLNDTNVLHSGSLNSIASELPSYFIKVHRSYLVNAKHIVLMRRLPAGTGEIELSNGLVVPVSRRLLPKLKETLAARE
jgi:hypothetical protein